MAKRTKATEVADKKVKDIEEKLKKFLGCTYGGPSLSYDKDKDRFVLYVWSDAPVGMMEYATGKTLAALLRKASQL